MAEQLGIWKEHLQIASKSDVGMRRSNNQDDYANALATTMEQWKKTGHLFVVADGMGAHAAGELASRLAAEKVPHLYSKYNDVSAPEALKRAMIEANAEIHRRGQANEEFYNMGTTCSSMLLLPQGLVLAHIGDSRIYRVRNRRLEQLTFDHSLVWEMRASGQFLEDASVESVVPKNVITRSLGPYPDVKVDMEGPFPVEPGDVFMLCSDGLTGPVTDEELGPILANLPPAEAATMLVDLANLRGGPDNITLTIVKVLSTELSSRGSQSDPITLGTSSSGKKITPLFWAMLVACVLSSIICLTLTTWQVAMLPLSLTLICLAWLVYQLSGLASRGTVVSPGKRFGKGPYVRVDCESDQKFVEQLREIVGELKSEAVKQQFLSNVEELDQQIALADAAAKKEDWNGALAQFARCISAMMAQIRDYFRQSGSDSHVDL